MLRLAMLALLAPLLASCGQVRPPSAPGCVLSAYRLLPGKVHPGLFSEAPDTFGETVVRVLNESAVRSLDGERQDVLVLSGGSQNGSFGAGLFAGMPRVPTYQIVTAVSTGALQSTMVFLANQEVPSDRVYAPYMTRVTGLGKVRTSNIGDLSLAFALEKEGDVMKVGGQPYLRAVRRGSLASFQPLRAMLEGMISPQTIRQVAAEGHKGRRLFVGVTNLDDGYGYAIDLTGLAMSASDDEAVNRVRPCYIDALIASSSVPPGVPPVSLRLTGSTDPDMFMDGGARYGVFYDQLREAIDVGKSADMTVIVNGRLYSSEWKDSKGARIEKWSILDFGLRAIDMLQNQVYRLSVNDAEQWGLAHGRLRMAFISNEDLTAVTEDPAQKCAAAAREDMEASAPLEFHPRYMRCMIDYGVSRGQREPWNKDIPARPERCRSCSNHR